MMKYVYIIVLALLPVEVFANDSIIEFECPKRIQTVQKILEPINGWHESVEPPFSTDSNEDKGFSEHNLDNANFSLSPPEQGEFLIPDNEHELSGQRSTARWEFTGSESMWVSCSYRGTTVYLSQKLPSSVKRCFIKQDETKGISIERIWCEK